jgi:hypothetical protein
MYTMHKNMRSRYGVFTPEDFFLNEPIPASQIKRKDGVRCGIGIEPSSLLFSGPRLVSMKKHGQTTMIFAFVWRIGAELGRLQNHAERGLRYRANFFHAHTHLNSNKSAAGTDERTGHRHGVLRMPGYCNGHVLSRRQKP